MRAIKFFGSILFAIVCVAFAIALLVIDAEMTAGMWFLFGASLFGAAIYMMIARSVYKENNFE
jgi:hypothetical protein